MAKKKTNSNKKSQKPVESASPLDIVPTNTGEPVPSPLEIPMPAEPPATDASSGEQSVLVEPVDRSIPKSVETSTFVPSTHLDSSQSIPHKAAGPLAAESTPAQQDPPMKTQQELHPQIAPIQATESGIANDNVDELHPAANEIEQPSIQRFDENPEADRILDPEPSLQEEHEAIQPIQDLTSTTVLPRPQLVQAPGLPGELHADIESLGEPFTIVAPEATSEDFAQSIPADTEAAPVHEGQMEMPTGETRAESPQAAAFDIPEAPTAPEVRIAESTEPAEIAGGAIDSDPVEETPSAYQEKPQSLPDLDHHEEDPTINEPFDATEDHMILLEVPEAPPIQPESLVNPSPIEDAINSVAEPTVSLHGEEIQAPAGIQIMPTAHEERWHQRRKVPAQVEQHSMMEENANPPEVAQDSRETDAEVYWQQGQHERPDQEKTGWKRREDEEAEAIGLLQELEREMHEEQTQEKTEAAQAVEEAQEESGTKTEEQKESERKQREGAVRERVERETLEQVFEAKRLLALMEQEIRANEAQDEIEKAALAERAKRENEQLEYKQMQRERLEQHRRNMEARMAAGGATSAQKEADQIEAARKAIEEATRDRVPNGVGPCPMPPSAAQQRWPPDELPPRAETPPSAANGAHDRSPSQSDRPFRSYRSFAPHARKLRTQEGPNYPPKPYAIAHSLEDDIPAAPSPPVSRVRPRYAPTFDSDDESEFSLVPNGIASRRPFSGEAHEVSRAHMGPHQPRSVFASRVPLEPAYPAPPPNYHPSYHAPPSQPPHYPAHGYAMSQQGCPAPNPNPYGPSSPSSSSPYQEAWSQYPPGYPPYGSPHHQQDSSGSRDYPLHALEGRPAIEDGPGDVYGRIAQTIPPDLSLLLARYQDTHSQLSAKEDLLRRAGAEKEEKLRAKDGEIFELKEKIRTLENRHSAEANRLHFQIGNLEDQVRDLREQIAENKKAKEEAEELRRGFYAAMKSWEERYRELEDVHRALERSTAEERERTWRDFDEWKSTTNTKHDAEKIALAIQFDKKLKKAEAAAEEWRQDAAEASELRARLEEALQRERENQESWATERECLIRERDYFQKTCAEQRELLETQHLQTEGHSDIFKKAVEEAARADSLAQEKDELMKQYEQLKAESQQEKELIKSVASNLESEKSRLEKMMECYGDIAEIKSKGDAYYLSSFSHLQKQIIDLATTHFVHLPVRPPPEDLGQVPSNLPSFLGDTIASRQVRAAYIAHTVAKLITYRVFGPFLFSLGRRYDKADSLFSSMSHHIREKSTRKEAIWRQQTLLAAFTSSGAKQRINTAAGTVVEEIVNAIKHFADPREEEGIKVAVKRIVKLAAETWRFARLEREMITAVMPALHDVEHQFTGSQYWPAYRPDATGSPMDTSTTDSRPQLLLRMFPVVFREAKHENFQINGEPRDEGCVLHHGLALYDDSEPVVARLEELKSAGLPSHTTLLTSPTDEGKFPAPACPPPRDEQPNPIAPRSPTKPEMSTAEKTHPRPRSPTEKPDKPEKHEKSSAIKRALSLFSGPLLDDNKTVKPPLSTYSHMPPPPPPTSVFTSPRNIIGMPVDSLDASQPPSSKRKPPPPPPKPASKPEVPLPLGGAHHRTSSETAAFPTSFSRTTSDETVPYHDVEPDTCPPTPVDTVSPVYDAIDEIESLLPQRTRTASTTHSRRRSTHTRRSGESAIDDELDDVITRPESIRRRSTYASSVRTYKSADTERTDRSERTDKSERTERSERTEKSERTDKSERTHKSERTSRTEKSDRSDKTEREKARYLYESRSAGVKALYPSPATGQSGNGSTKNSSRSEKSERRRDRGSKDLTKDSKESKRESREIRRMRSVSDSGTWDTNSVFTHNDFAPTTVSTNVPYPHAYDARRDSKEVKRESKEIRRQRSISDAGTWDTASEVTRLPPPTTVSTNVPYPTGLAWELRRTRSIPDDATWDTSSEITQRAPETTISTNIPYPSGFSRESRRMSVSDAGTWDTESVFTQRAPPTTVSTNVPYPTNFSMTDVSHVPPSPRQMRRLSVSDAGTWDTNTEITTHRPPPTTVSTNVPYPTNFSMSDLSSVPPSPHQLRRLSVSDAGTWDTNTEITTYRPPPTTVSTNVPYPTGMPQQLRRLSVSDAGTWDTESVVTHRAPPTTVSTNVPYPSGGFGGPASSVHLPGPFERLKRESEQQSFSDDGSDSGTWDTSSEITHANNGPATIVSANVPYKSQKPPKPPKPERPRFLRSKTSLSDAGTWDTNSVITTNDMKTTVSTNVPYASERRSR